MVNDIHKLAHITDCTEMSNEQCKLMPKCPHWPRNTTLLSDKYLKLITFEACAKLLLNCYIAMTKCSFYIH